MGRESSIAPAAMFLSARHSAVAIAQQAGKNSIDKLTMHSTTPASMQKSMGAGNRRCDRQGDDPGSDLNSRSCFSNGVPMYRPILMMLLALPALPVPVAQATELFAQGQTQFSLVVGNGYALDRNYFVIGASASYYVLDGLGVGMSLERWSGGDRNISNYAPFAQYVFLPGSSVRPYVGGFYRHTSIDGLPGINSVGEQAGITIASGSNAYVSAGLVHESYLDCQNTVYRSCSSTYTNVSVTFGF